MATPSRADILVTGSGSLASALLHVVASASTEPLVIVIASRASERLTCLRTSVDASAKGTGRDVIVQTADLSWSMESLRAVLGRWRPRLVVHTASLQSPWSLNGSDGWCRLIRAAGYGFTLPLHFALARRMAHALRAMDEGSLFINACYPDAVNALLAAEGLPIVSGIGNVSILATLLSLNTVERPRHLQLVAHHCHVAEAISGLPLTDEFHAWQDGVTIDEAARAGLQGMRIPKGSELNKVTASSAFGVMMALLGKSAPQHANLPGALGLPGGYPVLVGQGALTLNLPASMPRNAAIEQNQRAALRDGVRIGEDGWAVFSDGVQEAVRQARPEANEIASAFHYSESEERAASLAILRTALGG